ncbi:retrovirus-related pol polyprotein from transposon TNT 1-94 [Tanacetum coccineum]
MKLQLFITISEMIQVHLRKPSDRIKPINGTEFVNQTLREYYEKVGISHETSVARSPQQNGVVERRNLEPKNYKEALTQACWIEAMQEELHEFERLEVWELVPPPNKAFWITPWWRSPKLDNEDKEGNAVDPSHYRVSLRLSSDVTSKEATLQVVYDVLKLTPFYKAFQVTADTPEIYMQEFWASAYVHNDRPDSELNNKKLRSSS